jgi:hypothetical protein
LLDAYIIDRIRREEERNKRENVQIPLHIDPEGHDPDQQRRRKPERERDDRGSVVIDFHV